MRKTNRFTVARSSSAVIDVELGFEVIVAGEAGAVLFLHDRGGEIARERSALREAHGRRDRAGRATS